MTPSPSNISIGFCLTIALSMGGCNPSGLSVQEKNEFRQVIRALDALTGSPEEDRTVRLEELENVPCETNRIAALKTSCVASYRSFENATHLLSDARAKTAETESAVAKAREVKAAGQAIDIDRENELRKLSHSTALALKAVNGALDKAESLVAKCEAERQALEQLVSQN